MKQTRCRFIQIIAICLVLSLTVPVAARAASVEPAVSLANYYIDSCDSHISSVGMGRIQIWFEITGSGTMDKIGALSVEVYESTDNTNWTLVQTFTHDVYVTMLTENSFYYRSSVSHQGVPGRYYKAYVTFWAERNNSSESREMWTDVKKAS